MTIGNTKRRPESGQKRAGVPQRIAKHVAANLLVLAFSVALSSAADLAASPPGAPHGRVMEFELRHSQVFPGAAHRISVYVPAQYTGDQPACLYVGFDGLGLAAPSVFDDLIYQHEMPVTIGIGISPGSVESARAGVDPRFERSLEFDGLNDDLARFVIEEVIPEVKKHSTADGLAIRLSDDPDDHAAGGTSTGAAAAFTIAWRHPEYFRRVFTGIGTFVGMRGADGYAVLIRKTEPKPIRIYMQDGANDEWMGGPEMGDWWIANQAMLSALSFAGYQVNHAWGNGTHDSSQAAAVFPDAMRWLWAQWPQPIVAGESGNTFLRQILLPGDDWKESTPADQDAPQLTDSIASRQVVGPNGRSYAIETASGKLWLKTADHKQVALDSRLKAPAAIALSPDHLWLAVAESQTKWGYSYRIQPDGTLDAKRRFYRFEIADEEQDSGVSGWVADREGRLYAATRLGIQIFDRNGRVRAILPVPGGQPLAISFGGPSMQQLYVLGSDHRIYHRQLRISGMAPGSAAVDLPTWEPW